MSGPSERNLTELILRWPFLSRVQRSIFLKEKFICLHLWVSGRVLLITEMPSRLLFLVHFQNISCLFNVLISSATSPLILTLRFFSNQNLSFSTFCPPFGLWFLLYICTIIYATAYTLGSLEISSSWSISLSFIKSISCWVLGHGKKVHILWQNEMDINL